MRASKKCSNNTAAVVPSYEIKALDIIEIIGKRDVSCTVYIPLKNITANNWSYLEVNLKTGTVTLFSTGAFVPGRWEKYEGEVVLTNT